MDTIISRFHEFTPVVAQQPDNQIPDHERLFSLAVDIYMGRSLSPEDIDAIERTTPPNSLFFLLAGNKYIHPEGVQLVSPEFIRQTISNDPSCLFYRQIAAGHGPSGSDGRVCAARLGRDRFGEEISAGVIIRQNWRQRDYDSEIFYQTIGLLRRFYDEFSASGAIQKFLDDNSSYRYAIRSDSRKIIKSLPPTEADRQSDMELTVDRLNSLVLSELPNLGMIPDDKIIPDNRIKNLDIKNCTILDTAFTLISVAMKIARMETHGPHDTLIQGFSQTLSNRLEIIERAIGNLNNRPGISFNQEDLELMNRIHGAAEEIGRLARWIELYNGGTVAGISAVDFNQLMCRKTAEFTKMRAPGCRIKMELTDDPPGIKTDPDLVNLAMNEILETLLSFGAGEVNIQSEVSGESMEIHINCRICPELLPNRSDLTGEIEQTFEKSGSVGDRPGLLIAGRVVETYGGRLVINHDNGEFRACLTLPASFTGSHIYTNA
nr:hypothetical protein [candidate division Zixibacteria bacterium]